MATAARLAGLPGTELAAVAHDFNRAVHFYTLDGGEALSVNLADGLRIVGGIHGEPYFVDQQGCWTAQGLWLTHGAVGIGGYILFEPPFGVVDLVHPKTSPIRPPPSPSAGPAAISCA